MIQIRVSPELWGTNMLPQGILQKWLRADGGLVKPGDPVAIVQIEDCLHELMAPAAGWLAVECSPNTVIEPGMVIGHLTLP